MRDGSSVLTSKYTSGDSFLSFGKNVSLALETSETSLVKEKHSGFSLRDIVPGVSSLQAGEKTTFYQQLTMPCSVYTPEAITDSVTTEVLGVTADIVQNIIGDTNTTGLLSQISAMQSALIQFNSQTSADCISEVTDLINSFILKPAGVRIELQMGAVSTDETNLKTTRLKSAQNHNIIASLNVISASNNTIGSINIDEAGNLNINMPAIYKNGVLL